jgi:Protein of unknown function (DUF669)
MALKSKKKAWSVEVDFEGVESGGFSLEDGTYPAEITKAELTESSEGNPMITISWVVTGGKKKGTRVGYDNCSLLPQALWKVKSLMEALGNDVPDSALEIEESDLVGGECSIEVTNETYEGKKRPKVTGYVSSEDKTDEDDDDDRPAKGKKKPAKTEEDDSDDDDDEAGDKKVGKKPAKKAGKKAEAEPSDGFEEGDKVKFRDEKGKLIKGTVTEIDGDTAKVEDVNEDVWELEVSDLEAA